MVNTILFVIVGLSLLIWLVQEVVARRAMQRTMDTLITNDKVPIVEELPRAVAPDWHEWTLKAIIAIWLVWGASIFLIKDGDFALILVVLTLFSGLVAGLDRFVFAGGRKEYQASAPVSDYLEKQTEEKRIAVRHILSADFIVAEYAKSFFPVLAIVLVLRSFIVEPFQIPSASMVPTLQVGDYILVNKFTYGIRLPVIGTKIVDLGEPSRGDVMVFFPPDDARYFIKRVIGLPGDVIRYKHKQLFVNGQPAAQDLIARMPPQRPVLNIYTEHLGAVSHAIHTNDLSAMRDFEVVVKPGHYFMMGDNRDNSSDSRVWGQVPEKNVVGKAFAIWMHWESFTQLPSFSRVGAIR